MSSSYGSLWPGVPASANIVKSQDVYATATTPLTVIGSGGQQPSTAIGPNKAPTIPALVSATSSSLLVSFDVAGVTGTPTPTYGVYYDLDNPNPNTFANATLSTGTIYTAVVNGLQSLRNYYFESVAQNVSGTSTSVVSAAYSTLLGDPSSPPGVPVQVGAITNTQIPVQFNISSATGTAPLSFYGLYGTSSPPTLAVSTIALNVSTLQAVIPPLNPLTNYYFASGVVNPVGTLSSATLGPIQTQGAPDPGPALPVLVSAGVSTITASTDVSAVVGVPTPVYSMTYVLSTGGATQQVNTVNTGGNIWTAYVSSLTANSVYNFDAFASNVYGSRGSGLSVLSTIGGGGTPPSSAPAVPVQVGAITNQQITIQFNTAGITGTAPLSYYALYGTTSSPTTAVSTTLYSANTQQAIFPLLNSLTNYYFASGVVNPVGTLSSAVLGPIATQGPASAPAPPVLVSAGVSTITASTDASAVVGTPTPTIHMTYIQVPGGTGVEVSTINTGGNIWTAYVSSLTANTNYGFTAQAINRWGGSGSGSVLFSTTISPSLSR
jgi:hypothetical protein